MAILKGVGKFDLGELDRRITIKSIATTTGDQGQESPSTVTSDTVWAKIIYRFGDEDEDGGRQEMNSRIEFLFRYYTGLTNKHRITYDSNDYDIIHIEEIGRKGFHKVLCELRL